MILLPIIDHARHNLEAANIYKGFFSIIDQKGAAHVEICEPILNMEVIYQLSMFQEIR